ncbi:MAG TPA: glycosyl hydrolase, partial [Thermomicrobiales bacterium]|nr:glycosyl hydrolase [Thermomicrobiales bacterium]
PDYLDRIRLAVDEGERLGLTTWIYDEMNWPSGTADFRVVRERPDLSQRYLECLSFPIRGPWFACLTGGDSRYIDFERSTPVAAFALSESGQVVDLTPNLSFENVIPWEVPPGNWRLMYMVEKRADYYIDALNPEATAEFLRLGYEPYAANVRDKMPSPMVGFYTDEPAMHYYVTGNDNPIVPWTKDMFRRFYEHNGYNLRQRLPDLFFDVGADSPRVRHDFYTTLTEFYANAYYRQIHDWCREHNVLFTGHLLYEEWLRQMVRVEGNPFKHYPNLDVTGVDHLYPIIGDRNRPAEHVAMKLASSAAHQNGSPRLLCESFGGIFMDATMQRMKWLTDWQFVLGVNLLNPHGFHYTLEGPRKRDWPPSMFYQYPWWHFYGEFSNYVARLSHLLSGGRHVAKVALLWPINTIFGTYTPQQRTPLANRTEFDFNVLTDLLMRLHHDFDYLDEDTFAEADIEDGTIRVRDEAHELLILPPMTHLKLSTVEALERFVAAGGRVLGTIFLPATAFGERTLVDVSDRIRALFGVDPTVTQQEYATLTGIESVSLDHAGGGKTAFLRSNALNRQLPRRLQSSPGVPEGPHFLIEEEDGESRYWYAPPNGELQDLTVELKAERAEVARALDQAINGLVQPDVVIDNPDVFCLHRVKDGRDLYFLVNSTRKPQTAEIALAGHVQPWLWDPSTAETRPLALAPPAVGVTRFSLDLPPVGSAFITTEPAAAHIAETVVSSSSIEPILLDGEWEFIAEDANALVIRNWLADSELPGTRADAYTAPDLDTSTWLPVTMGAWAYQLPAEPERPYPIDVWYRIGFEATYLPPHLDLIIDGFAGSNWSVHVNGQSVTANPVRSKIDSQMKALDITPHLREGANVIAVRLTVTKPTDGLLDLVKLTGDFALDEQHRIAAPISAARPASWTAQGYPYFSGRGLYRHRFTLPEAFVGQRLHLAPELIDDAVEIIVNSRSVGVRLWPPYGIDVTDYLRPGENVLELRVANTLINLLEAVERPSGLSGSPRLVPYQRVPFGP